MCLLLHSGAALAQSAVHPLTLLLESDADWAQVDVHGLQLRILKRELSVAGDAAVPALGLAVRKLAGDPTPVSLRATCEAMATGDAVEFVLTRADVGKTRLRIWAGSKVIVDARQEGPLPGRPQNRQTIAVDLAKVLAAPPLPRRDYGKRALAFLYGWYGTPQGPAGSWQHWDPAVRNHAGRDTPQLGWYDAADPAIVAQQVAWAREAGLDGFVLSWWPGDAHEAQVLEALLKVVRGTDFTVSVYVEDARDAGHLRTQMLELAQKYGNRDNWLRVDGKPVLFVYGRTVNDLSLPAMQSVMRDMPAFVVVDTVHPVMVPTFDGSHTYVGAAFPERYHQQFEGLAAKARLYDKLLCATVLPGYDDSHVRTPALVVRRDDGRFFERAWATASLADWVIVSTWNEWHEGSEIEPSLEYGRAWLDRTREFVRRWRGAP